MSRKQLSEAEQDLLAAIDRIAVGKPKNRENQKLLRTGKLELTPTTVAREAKRSRQSVYRSERIREALNVTRRLHQPGSPNVHTIVEEAREDRRTIAEENQILISNLAKAHNVALDLLEELKDLQLRAERRNQRIKEARLEIAALRDENRELKSKLETLRHIKESN